MDTPTGKECALHVTATVTVTVISFFSRCYYDPDVDLERKSLDIYGNYEGGGVCQECGHYTAGINCETCTDGYFRPEGVLPNATEPCIRKLFIQSHDFR